jgi:hypothetical protein
VVNGGMVGGGGKLGVVNGGMVGGGGTGDGGASGKGGNVGNGKLGSVKDGKPGGEGVSAPADDITSPAHPTPMVANTTARRFHASIPTSRSRERSRKVTPRP